MSHKTKTLTYRFRLESGIEKEFVLKLTYPGMKLQGHGPSHPPAWTELGFHQCPNCPLNKAEHAHCPIALRLVDVIEFFRHHVSIELADISIISDHREIHKKAPVQYGVSSLMGIFMVASGCPVMDKLRPMVFTHLPFSTVDETLYRAVAMYLVSQFLIYKRKGTPDWDLDGLISIYEEVGKVNRHFIKRLLSISPKDASLNALGGLDCFASYNSVTIADSFFDDLEDLFVPHTAKVEPPQQQS